MSVTKCPLTFLMHFTITPEVTSLLQTRILKILKEAIKYWTQILD